MLDSWRLCLMAGAGAIVLYLAGYFILYRRLMHGEKRLTLGQGTFMFLLFMYLGLVLIATLLTRGGYGYRGVNLSLFITYRDAWNSFSARAWRFIILNILMFVPIGFLLPLAFTTCKKFWFTYLTGALITILIEGKQYVSSQGIFEISDIIHNVLGCMIGYGMWMLVHTIYGKIRKRDEETHRIRNMLCLQIPLAVTGITFGLIFFIYHVKELGNLDISYIVKEDMRNIKLTSEIELSNKADREAVYRTHVGTKEEARKIADKIFALYDSEVDETDYADESVNYYSRDGKCSCMIEYAGLKTWFTRFGEHQEANAYTTFSVAELKDYLKPFGIEVPDNVKLTRDSDKSYTLTADMIQDKEDYVDGSITVSINKDNEVARFDNQMVKYTRYKEFPVISEQDAYKEIEKGKFRFFSEDKLTYITVTEVNLSYVMDSKSFYQPVYSFSVKTDEGEGFITIPAIK